MNFAPIRRAPLRWSRALPALLVPWLLLVGCSGPDDPGTDTPAATDPAVTDPVVTDPPPTDEPPTATASPEVTDSPEPATSDPPPTEEPTDIVPPTDAPTEEPTAAPTEEPTAEPTDEPTVAPTEEPTAEPTEEPTVAPTAEPTDGATPTDAPTDTPTGATDTPSGTEPENTPAANPTFYVYQSFPTDGALSVPTSVVGSFYFSQPYAGSTSGLHITLKNMSTGTSQPMPSVNLTGDKTRVSTPGNLTLSLNTSYCLVLNVDHDPLVPAAWPLQAQSCFTTEKPCGTAIQVGYDTLAIQFGATPARGQPDVVAILNNLLKVFGNDLYVAMMFDDLGPSATFPQSNVRVAVGEYRPGNPPYIVPTGWTSSATGCSIDGSGKFSCTSDETVFPLPLMDTDGNVTETLFLYLKDITMTGLVKVSGNFTDMDTYVLKGHMLYDDVVRLATAGGYPEIAAAVILDLDTDGDGEKDAATFELNTAPVPMTLSGCTP